MKQIILGIIFSLVIISGAFASPYQSASENTLCYAISLSSNNPGLTLITEVAPGNFDSITNERNIGAPVGITINSIAYRPENQSLYATSRNRVGVIDLTTGAFSPLPKNITQVNGGQPGQFSAVSLNGLAFDPFRGILFGLAKEESSTVLVQIDPADGGLIKNAFNSRADFVSLQDSNGPQNVVSIAIDPTDDVMYGVAKSQANSNSLVKIDKKTGDINVVGPLKIDDLNSIAFRSNGELFGVAGGINGALYDVDKTSGNIGDYRFLDNGTSYKSLTCAINSVNVISGKLFRDDDRDGQTSPPEKGAQNVIVELYRDLNQNALRDKADLLVATNVTDKDGNYRFVVASEGNFILELATDTLPKHYALNEPNLKSIVLTGADKINSNRNFALAKQRFSDIELSVKFVAKTPKTAIDNLLAHYNLSIKRYLSALDIYLLKTPSGKVEFLETSLETEPIVQWAEVNYMVDSTTQPTDPDYNQPSLVYAPQLVNSEQAWNVTVGSPALIVAVVDSGLSLNHPEFSGRVVAGYDFVNNDNDPSDDNGHGTHVAGIIAAAINNDQGSVGIAPDVKIMPVKVLNALNIGDWSNIASGITWAVDHGAKIINLSLGGPLPSQTLLDAINYAAANNVLVVAAAGNDNSNAPFYPAYYDAVFSVAATTASDTRRSNSNYGDWVDVSAPGDNIWSTLWTSTNPNAYGFLSGTSMSAPHVAGEAALVMSSRPELSIINVRTLIQQTAKDLGTVGADPYFGWGRINVGNALAASVSWVSPTPTPTFIPQPTSTLIPTNTPTPTSTPTPAPTPVLVRVNVGGSNFVDSQGNLWLYDRAWDGSIGYAAGTAKTSFRDLSNTLDDALYQARREGPGEYRLQLPNGTYQVALKFAEFDATRASSRVMKISIEASVVENAFSIYGVNNARYLAVDRSYVVNVTDGQLNIGFAQNGGSLLPVISAIEVKPYISIPPTPTVTSTSTPCSSCGAPKPTATPYNRRVNVGGKAFADTSGVFWSADQEYEPGAWGYSKGSAKSSSIPVSNTSDDVLYQQYREAPEQYRFTVPNGTYEVKLKFVEFSTSNATDRMMRISLESTIVENAFSIYSSAARKAVAVDRVYQVAVNDGVLNIGFSQNNGKLAPIISAIQITQLN